MSDEYMTIDTDDDGVDELPMNGDQAIALAHDVEWLIILAGRLQLEGYLENDIDKTNMGCALVSMMYRVDILPEASEYSKIIREMWKMYHVPGEYGKALSIKFNTQITDYNELIMDTCRKTRAVLRKNGVVKDEQYSDETEYE